MQTSDGQCTFTLHHNDQPCSNSDLGLIASFHCSQTGLWEMTPGIGNLVKLKSLMLHGNAHDGKQTDCIPEAISRLQQLTELHLDCVPIGQLPAGLAMLGNLETLHMARCYHGWRFPPNMQVVGLEHSYKLAVVCRHSKEGFFQGRETRHVALLDATSYLAWGNFRRDPNPNAIWLVESGRACNFTETF
jgi:hypothetical protein